MEQQHRRLCPGKDSDSFFRGTGEITSSIWRHVVFYVAKMWPSLPFCFHEHHFSSQDIVITLHVVLCGPLYIRFWSLRAFGNIMCSHYCRLHKTQAGNELLSTFPLAWHIVLVIEFKDVKDLSYLKESEEVHLFIKNNAPENKWYAIKVDWWHEIKANCRTL